MRCLFHADDCGLAPGITADILSCVDAGRVQSTSVMMNSPYAGAALHELALRPQVLVGVHLNILEGKALSPPEAVPGLTDQAGFFSHTLGSLWAKLTFGNKKARDTLANSVYTEICAQIDAMQLFFPNYPLRLDSHLHIHVLPPLREVMATLFAKYTPAYVRVPDELPCWMPTPFPLQCKGQLRRGILSLWGKAMYPLVRQHGASHADFFAGAFSSGEMDLPQLTCALGAIQKQGSKNPLVEIMVHPGGISGNTEGIDQIKTGYHNKYISPNREKEKAMLLSKELPRTLAQYQAVLYTPPTPLEAR